MNCRPETTRACWRLRRLTVWVSVAAVAVVVVVVAGCASPVTLSETRLATPTAVEREDSAPPGTAPPLSLPTPFEQRQFERAVNLGRQKWLADAALAWEVLVVLRPDVPDYRERLAETRRQIDAAVAERLPRAASAAQRGDIDNATQQYLSILALQPNNALAAGALRALERERNKRQYLGRHSRLTITRRATVDAEMSAVPTAESASASTRVNVNVDSRPKR